MCRICGSKMEKIGKQRMTRYSYLYLYFGRGKLILDIFFWLISYMEPVYLVRQKYPSRLTPIIEANTARFLAANVFIDPCIGIITAEKMAGNLKRVAILFGHE